MEHVFVLRGYGLAFARWDDALQTIKSTWSGDQFKIISVDAGAVVIRDSNAQYTTVNIDKVEVLQRATHL